MNVRTLLLVVLVLAVAGALALLSSKPEHRVIAEQRTAAVRVGTVANAGGVRPRTEQPHDPFEHGHEIARLQERHSLARS